jgi:hypothetical protein
LLFNASKKARLLIMLICRPVRPMGVDRALLNQDTKINKNCVLNEALEVGAWRLMQKP